MSSFGGHRRPSRSGGIGTSKALPYSHQKASPSTKKASTAGNRDSGNHRFNQGSCSTLATTASANPASEASNPASSATPIRIPIQLSGCRGGSSDGVRDTEDNERCRDRYRCGCREPRRPPRYAAIGSIWGRNVRVYSTNVTWHLVHLLTLNVPVADGSRIGSWRQNGCVLLAVSAPAPATRCAKSGR